jgi:hypothetical protein
MLTAALSVILVGRPGCGSKTRNDAFSQFLSKPGTFYFMVPLLLSNKCLITPLSLPFTANYFCQST